MNGTLQVNSAEMRGNSLLNWPTDSDMWTPGDTETTQMETALDAYENKRISLLKTMKLIIGSG